MTLSLSAWWLVIFGGASLLETLGVIPSSALPFIFGPLFVAALVYGFFYMKRRATANRNESNDDTASLK